MPRRLGHPALLAAVAAALGAALVGAIDPDPVVYGVSAFDALERLLLVG